MRRVHSIFHEWLASFFGVGSSLFLFSFSFSRFASVLANPIGRVSDWDSGSCPDPCPCPVLLEVLLEWQGIVIVDS